MTKKDIDFYCKELKKVANRETDLAWFNGLPNYKMMLYHEKPKEVTQNFAFTIEKKINDTTYEIITRNNIKVSSKFEILSQLHNDLINVKLKKLSVNNEAVEQIPTPMTNAIVVFDKPVELKQNDIVRIKCK